VYSHRYYLLRPNAADVRREGRRGRREGL